ncbi:hypothetical protein BDQ17DRAFT_1414031 [Cyathus striatus]|nr:hypothetical protein BDQ17DRAFT_1414031 [Cyathus striatus]
MKWSLPKLLYIIARYCGLFYLSAFLFSPIQNRYAEVSHHRCTSSMWFHTYGSQVPTGSVDLIFILRVCALYDNSKRIIFCLIALFIAQITVQLTFSTFVSIAYSKAAVAVPGIGCVGFIPDFLLQLQTTSYGCTLALQTTLFLLTFFRVGRDVIRDSGGLRNAITGNNTGVGKDALTTLVLHDGTLYFFILFGSTLITSVASALQLNPFLNITTPCYIAITSMMGSRLILKLRKMYDTQINECTPAVSRLIFFAEPSRTDSSLEEENINGAEEVVCDENEGFSESRPEQREFQIVLRRDSRIDTSRRISQEYEDS